MKRHYFGSANDIDELMNKETPKERNSDLGDIGLVERQHNHVYFYSDIDKDSIFSLKKLMREAENEMLKNEIDYGILGTIYIHISSYGGYVTDGFNGYDIINSCKVPTITISEGGVASAATFLLLAGKKRQMAQNSFILIHQLLGAHWGNYEQLKDDMKNSKEFMKKIRNLYKEKTKIPKEELNNILKHDLWWDAQVCLNYGLIDEIV